MSFTTIITIISAALRLIGLVKAAEALLKKFTKPEDPAKEVARVEAKELEVAARPDRPLDDVLDRL